MSSQPAPQQTDDPSQAAEESGQRPKGGTRWLVMGLIALVTVPIVWQEIPNEISRWFDAAAAEYIDAGDLDAAHGSLTDALAWNPANTEALLRRAELHQKSRNYDEALQDCEVALKARPALVSALAKKSELNQLVGKSDEAIEIWSELLKKSPTNPQLLNAVAYAHAVGNLENDEGMQHIQQAFEELGGYNQMLVAFANMYYACGDHERAFDMFDTVFMIVGAELRDLESQLHEDQTYREQHPIKRRRAELNAFVEKTEKHVSRLLRRNQGDEEEEQGLTEWFAEMLDSAELTAAGFESREIMNHAGTFASYLDTRGYLHYRRGDIASALADLDLAVEQMELVREFGQILNESQQSEQARMIFAEQTASMDHGFAVMLYHRSLVLEQLHRYEEAEADVKRIEELGFAADETLF